MKGMTIQLVTSTVQEYDPFGAPIITEVIEDVHDVLVGQPSTDDVTNSINLYGKKCEYKLGIPKGDTHDWVDAIVIIRGVRYRTIGFPERGIDENVPLRWFQNVKVERYAAV